jgi:hypothetical protein
MKKYIRFLATAVATVLVVSCKKHDSLVGSTTVNTSPERKIRFQLYTNKDFSGDPTIVNFSLFIRNANKTLLDSALMPMYVEDIPDVLNSLMIEKTVNDTSDLAAGFRYEIPNVGSSSYIDTSKAGNPFKIIDFAFQ